MNRERKCGIREQGSLDLRRFHFIFCTVVKGLCPRLKHASHA